MIPFCFGLMGTGLGMFLAMFCIGWLEDRSDRHAGIKWSRELDTYINWEQRLGLWPTGEGVMPSSARNA